MKLIPSLQVWPGISLRAEFLTWIKAYGLLFSEVQSDIKNPQEGLETNKEKEKHLRAELRHDMKASKQN